MKKCVVILLCCLVNTSWAQSFRDITGVIRIGSEAAVGAVVKLSPINKLSITTENGLFWLSKIPAGNYKLEVTMHGCHTYTAQIQLKEKKLTFDINLQPSAISSLQDVTVIGRGNENISGKLNDVIGTAIYAGKKTELINLKNINGNLATNNARQIYSRIAGLNIWEYDRGGLQLGIGGRGLSPNRSSNFNIRQNGYDIGADALGYPESYYTPSAEALDKIEIIRGAASLQYGPQFGGLINFVMKEGNPDKRMEITSRQTGASYGFFNSFNSVGGTVAKKKLNYYTFYQYKQGDDWRPNSYFKQHTAYTHLAYNITPKLKVTGEYTFMRYLAKQPGGLTDAAFAENPAQSVRARNWFRVNWNLISLSADYNFNASTRLNWRNYTLQGGRDALGNLGYINRPEDLSFNRDFLTDDYSNFGSELRFIHQYQFVKKQKNTFLAGVRVYKGLTRRKQGEANNTANPDFEFITPEPNRSSHHFPGYNLAFFSENIFKINKYWSITPGARVEYINTKSNGYYLPPTVFDEPIKTFDKRANPRSFLLLGIGTSLKPANGIEAYANISQNYRSINFNDLRVQNRNARIDSNLTDERGYNIDMGVRGTYKGWLYADISVFYLKYNDRIGSIFTKDSSFFTYRYRTNVSDSRNFGLECLLDGDIIKAVTNGKSKYKLNIFANLSVINARYTGSKNTAFENKLVEDVSPFTLRTGLSFGTQVFNVSYYLSYQARQYSDATNAEITPTAVDGIIPAYRVMDLSVSYNWRMLTFYTGVTNLANEFYFTRRADGYPGPGIIPADKRNIYATIQLKL